MAESVLDLFKLDGRRAIVTGGGRGIGQAIALLVVVMIICFVVRKPKTVNRPSVSGVKAAA